MRVRLVGIAVVLLLAAGVAPASATPVAPSPSKRAVRTQLRFDFNNGESLRPGSVVRNVSGKGSGKVLGSAHGRLTVVKGISGRGAAFPCASCGRALIEAPDRPTLDPQLRRFRFGAAVRMTPRQGAHHMNLIQKGYYNQSGGQYKLQIDLGRPSCVVSGVDGRVIARSSRNLANSRWHNLNCERVGQQVILRVDGVVRGRATGATGQVSNSSAVRIGAKKVHSGGNDQYHGRLDNVFVRIRV